ncbi:MAG: LysR family transcriptional regulator [Mesorhizobium sp.]|uniref:helix-turn-helix domain-containing protein n=1 Tax=Mesorhizobium sp. TaxID=1871066 RepID=UPI000FE305C7|nr:LysR family transcriptional regulator [Mesorhizobium sp.]RWJ04856.1 MAG: LysR family transcriptional regulator [Mesorhizobium sp.]RWJ11992.1 MAG: LysR family transcriptional regulator [Mesorhizobium sp.]
MDAAISTLGNGLILALAGSKVNLHAILHSIAALEQRSFHRAATVIGTDQSVVSRRIHALEDELGVSLFGGDRVGVRPTAPLQHGGDPDSCGGGRAAAEPRAGDPGH